MRNNNILVVEDDIDINNLIKATLEKDEYSVIQAFSGSEGLLRLDVSEFDLILLDLMLPRMDGEEVIKRIRENKNMPIIVISAKKSLANRVNILNVGADDYITKPFACEEISARVNSQLRRYKKTFVQEEEKEENTYKVRDLVLKVDSREVIVNGENINLTAHEFEILTILMKNPDKVYSRELLYEMVRKSRYYGEDNSVNVHISNVRKKIKDVVDEEYIKTVWGIGFKIVKS